ncbi:hypothetical protein DWB84_06790 [Saccharophagus sp. K07]|jgi:hypothetical protein|uniref:cytochrome c n=1 Tax=Saccharophagus sp. K07 TaxID=2283636 RepID=UPI001651F36A|nr:cytochrome c [Saccharophagus sp. K07]MBC6905166.1 hypothetical protein [Saccharophagus sp. K07]
MKLKHTFLPLVFICSLAGCTGSHESGPLVAAETNTEQLPARPTASLQEIMLGVIDPNVDALWNSISTTISAEGITEVRPETEEDWQTLYHHAILLREVYNLLIIPGRKVAHENSSTSTYPTELHADQIGNLIHSHWPDFVARAAALHDAAQLAVDAIKQRDVDALEAAGSFIEATCEACHSQFWYPGDAPPGVVLQ